MSFKKFFIIFILIIVLLLGLAGIWFYRGNIFSKDVLKLEILGPDQTGLAEEIEYTVKYKNNGNQRLESARLIFEYPQNSVLEEGKSQRDEVKLEDIYPGEERTLKFKARLLGKEGDTKEAKAWLSYKLKNLETRFESATTHTAKIKSSPLTFEFDLPSKIELGKEFRLRLNYFSNLEYPLSDIRIKISYPSGFQFISSTPEALGQQEWEVGLLNQAEGGRIEVLAKFEGTLGEQKIFRAQIGSWQEGSFVLLKEASKGVEIVKPAISITQLINGSDNYIASPGSLLHYEITFRNIGDKPFENLFLVAALEGKPFDFSTIKTTQGKFEGNSIIFDGRDIPKLQYLAPQEEGKAEFWIELKKDWEYSGSQDKNPVVKNKVFLSQAQEEFVTKVNSKLVLEQKAYFQDEVFGNSGPLPPEVGKATTYTVMWRVKNYYNDLKNVKVKAFLPDSVKLTGKIFPEDLASKFAFDLVSREIVWDIGDLPAGGGILSSSQNIAFQVALTPSDSQRGKTPEIIGEAKISAEDTWTEKTLELVSSGVDTTLPDDPTTDDGVVK